MLTERVKYSNRKKSLNSGRKMKVYGESIKKEKCEQKEKMKKRYDKKKNELTEKRTQEGAV